MKKKFLLFLIKYIIKKILNDPSLIIFMEKEARKTKTKVDDYIVEICKAIRKLI